MRGSTFRDLVHTNSLRFTAGRTYFATRCGIYCTLTVFLIGLFNHGIFFFPMPLPLGLAPELQFPAEPGHWIVATAEQARG